jgi:hypothetical protein
MLILLIFVVYHETMLNLNRILNMSSTYKTSIRKERWMYLHLMQKFCERRGGREVNFVLNYTVIRFHFYLIYGNLKTKQMHSLEGRR